MAKPATATKKPARVAAPATAAVRVPAKKAAPANAARATPARAAPNSRTRDVAPRTAEKKPATATAKLPKVGDNFGQFLVGLIQESHGTTGVAARNTVRIAFDALEAALRRPKASIRIPNLGTAQNIRKAARNHKNPGTGETVKKPAHNSVRVKVTRGLRTVD